MIYDYGHANGYLAVKNGGYTAVIKWLIDEVKRFRKLKKLNNGLVNEAYDLLYVKFSNPTLEQEWPECLCKVKYRVNMSPSGAFDYDMPYYRPHIGTGQWTPPAVRCDYDAVLASLAELVKASEQVTANVPEYDVDCLKHDINGCCKPLSDTFFNQMKSITDKMLVELNAYTGELLYWKNVLNTNGPGGGGDIDGPGMEGGGDEDEGGDNGGGDPGLIEPGTPEYDALPDLQGGIIVNRRPDKPIFQAFPAKPIPDVEAPKAPEVKTPVDQYGVLVNLNNWRDRNSHVRGKK